MVEHGWRHMSLGEIGRLIRHKGLPKDYTRKFLIRLAQHTPGERMSQDLVDSVLVEIAKHREVAPLLVDGFPSEPDHVALLPAGSILTLIQCDEALRQERLLKRSEETRRKWTPATERSLRDKYVDDVVDRAIGSGISTLFLLNNSDENTCSESLLHSLSILKTDAFED